jgi:hypothetical protein
MSIVSPPILYEQRDFPVFQNRCYASPEAAIACPKGDIRIVQDAATGIVCNAAFRPELLEYDADYQNEQAHSPRFQHHLEQVAHLVQTHLGRERLIEVGCGKGFFLEWLLQQGLDVTGFDPAYEGDNPRVRREYFRPGLIGQAHGLILRHVLEHVPNPVDFLFHLQAANAGQDRTGQDRTGQDRIYIEVPCLDWIVAHHAWFDIFYEHVNYFRLSDFERLFGTLYASGHLFGGQYLYVVAELASLRHPPYVPPGSGEPSGESRLSSTLFPNDFTRHIAAPITSPTGRCAVWGGASKGVIFCLLKQRQGQRVDWVIDVNPAKQGKYLPATGLRVSSPDEALPHLPEGSAIYVMNSNYLDEIRAMSGHRYHLLGIDHE